MGNETNLTGLFFLGLIILGSMNARESRQNYSTYPTQFNDQTSELVDRDYMRMKEKMDSRYEERRKHSEEKADKEREDRKEYWDKFNTKQDIFWDNFRRERKNHREERKEHWEEFDREMTERRVKRKEENDAYWDNFKAKERMVYGNSFNVNRNNLNTSFESDPDGLADEMEY